MLRITRPSARLLACLALCLAGCAERNAMGRSTVSLLPDSFLDSQAATLFAQEKTTKPLSQDARRTAMVQQVASRLIAVAQANYGHECAGFHWETQLFEDPKTVNAYCMPGGKIGIYSGILPVCQTEAGLAVVMGHEISHALLKHGNERATAQLGMAAVTALAGAAVAGDKKLGATEKQALMVAFGLGAELGVALPNSRVDENEADHMGLRLMALAGYDPAEAPRFWQRMAAAGAGKVPEWTSTHPSDERRVKRISEFQAEAGPLYQAAAGKYGLGEKL